jgi:hypothetical protein
MKIRPVGPELLHPDGYSDFVNAPKNKTRDTRQSSSHYSSANIYTGVLISP